MHMSPQLPLDGGVGGSFSFQIAQLCPFNGACPGDHEEATLAAPDHDAAGGVLPLLWHLRAHADQAPEDL